MWYLKTLTLLTVGIAVLGIAPARAQELLPASGKVIYGTDDRIDVYEESNPDRLDWADSTCALVFTSSMLENEDGTFTLLTTPFRQLGLPPCEGEPFANQPTASFCSGFLAASDIVVTAGHCTRSRTLENIAFVFGFDMENAITANTIIPANRVYFGATRLGEQVVSNGADFSVVRLDRPVSAPGIDPLPFRQVGTIGVGTQIGVIGHPSGLPKKISFGAQTTVRSLAAEFFVANLDTYGGNSGSPVFNALTGTVEGVLVRGETDYRRASGCFESNRIADNVGGEDVTKATVFAPFVVESTPEGEPEGDPEGAGEGEPEGGPDNLHSADTNGNGRISLSELLRVVQLANADAYRCSSGTEDGYAPSIGAQSCAHHSSDFSPKNFSIALDELLRTIQIYNSNGYFACDSGEDGFCS